MTQEDKTPEKDPIESAHEWLVHAADILGLDKAEATALTRELLELTKEVAHNRSRPAAPLTAYLVGLASANGAEAREGIGKLMEALRAR